MISPAWITGRRLVLYGGLFLALEAALTVMIALGKHGFFGPDEPFSIDFVSFYTAGQLVLAGTPALAYDQAAHHALEQRISGAGIPYVFFYYPPVFLLPCALLALLPYFVAHGVFLAVTLAAHLAVLRGILGPWRPAWVVAALAFPATFWTIGMGQNAFLNAALLGGATLLLERRERWSGALLGCLAIKPHVAMLAPFALLAAGRRAAFAVAASVAAGLALLTAALFGLDTWRAWLNAAGGADRAYTTGVINLVDFPTLYAALRMNGAPNGVGYAAQVATALLMAVLVTLAFRNPARRAAACAALAACTLLAMPVLSFNDQILAVTAGAWLVRDARRMAFAGWEVAFLILCYPACLLAPLVAELWRVPLGLLADAGLAAICLRRALMSERLPA